jgi:hypothetical protein
MKKSWPALAAVLVLALLAVLWTTGALPSLLKTKKQRAREAIEAVEVSCTRAAEGGGIDVALDRQYQAKTVIEALDYEDQPPYRERLNEAWKPCADYWARQTVRDILEPKARPLSRDELIAREAALEFLENHAKKRSRADLYPYPDD